MNYDVNWARWCWASMAKHFNDIGVAEVFTDAPLVFLDVETTGLKAETDVLLEVACLRVGDRDASFVSLVNPGRPIPPYITKINGITDAMVLTQGLPAGQVAGMLLGSRILDYSILVAHNVSFDMGFLAVLLGPAVHCCPQIDTLSLAMHLLPGEAKYGLQPLKMSCGLPSSQAHRALGDVETVQALLAFLVGTSPRPLATWELMLPWATATLQDAEMLTQIYAGIAEETALSFDYLKPGEITPETRTLTPKQMAYDRGKVMVRGYDHLREEERTFRLDRIVGGVHGTA